MWDLPGPELEPVSPALAGGLLATVPPGKPQGSNIFDAQNSLIHVVVGGQRRGYWEEEQPNVEFRAGVPKPRGADRYRSAAC